MSRGSKVGGTKRRVLDIVGFAAIVVLFLLYMVPFILVLLNSFKQKRDIIKNPFSRVFFALMAASMIIPFQAIMIPLVSIYGSGLHMLNHRLTLIFMHTGFAMSMSVFIYPGFIKSGIPLSLEEAAYLDGCTNVQTFFKIVFPLLKPTTATLVILNVLAFWNDYLLPSLVLTVAPILVLYLFLQKEIIDGVVAGAVKS